MGAVDGTNVGFSELMNARQASISEVAQTLGQQLVREAQVVAVENQMQETYDQRVEACACTPPEEQFGDDGGAQIREFGHYMAQNGFPGATRVSPAEEKPVVAPAKPSRPSYLEALGDSRDVMPVRRGSAAWAALTGKVKPPVDQTPTYAYVYEMGTTRVGISPIDEEPVGLDWNNTRPTPDAPAIIVRKGDKGNFDVVEVGMVETQVDKKGKITANPNKQPLPMDPTAEEGVDFRLGSYRRVMSLSHLEQVVMPDAVRATIPEHPAGAVFVDADGNLREFLIGTAEAALASTNRTAAVRVAASAPAVAPGRTFPTQATGAAVPQPGLVAAEGTVLLESPDTTPNGHVVPAQRGESDPVTA